VDKATFIDDERWRGTNNELAVELGSTGDDQRLRAALAQIWTHRAVRAGPWKEIEDFDSPSIPAEQGGASPLYGLIEVEAGKVTGRSRHHQSHRCPRGRLGLAEREWQGSYEGSQHWIEIPPLSKPGLSHRVADVLLMVPSFRVLPRSVEPHRRRIGARWIETLHRQAIRRPLELSTFTQEANDNLP
jgi:hypothetical protein